MPESRKEIEEAAIGWLIRLRDGGAEDWERFVLWLEANPVHAEIYDEVALADRTFDSLPRARPRAIVPVPARPPSGWVSRRAFVGWGGAAALLATLGYVSLIPRSEIYAVETGLGERRSVDLAGGSRIDLNGSTKIFLDRDNSRFARLDSGEALFTVAHDAARPFIVEVGDALLQDMGTIFNVIRSGSALEVAVAEGAVLFNPEREAVNLSPGMVLRQAGGDASVSLGDPGEIGGWHQQRLSYSGAPIARVAADLTRNLGVPVTASPEVAANPFSGLILLERDRELLFQRVSLLLGVEVRRSGDGWLLTEDR